MASWSLFIKCKWTAYSVNARFSKTTEQPIRFIDKSVTECLTLKHFGSETFCVNMRIQNETASKQRCNEREAVELIVSSRVPSTSTVRTQKRKIVHVGRGCVTRVGNGNSVDRACRVRAVRTGPTNRWRTGAFRARVTHPAVRVHRRGGWGGARARTDGAPLTGRLLHSVAVRRRPQSVRRPRRSFTTYRHRCGIARSLTHPVYH